MKPLKTYRIVIFLWVLSDWFPFFSNNAAFWTPVITSGNNVADVYVGAPIIELRMGTQPVIRLA
jgi:hypothetical protein